MLAWPRAAAHVCCVAAKAGAGALAPDESDYEASKAYFFFPPACKCSEPAGGMFVSLHALCFNWGSSVSAHPVYKQEPPQQRHGAAVNDLPGSAQNKLMPELASATLSPTYCVG